MFSEKKVWVGYYIAILLFMMTTGITSSFGAAAPELPQYKSVDELYAALAKLPFDQRQAAILAGALKEGKIVTYEANTEESIGPVFKGFEKKYPGMEVEFFRTVAEEIVVKAMTEVQAGRWIWDTVSIGSAYGPLMKAKALANHQRLFPDNKIPKQFEGDYWFGTELQPLIIAYNTNLLKASAAPKSYMELIEPQWKGKVSIDTGPENLLVAMLKKWGTAKTENWLDKLVNDNRSLLRKGHTTQTKLLIAGEFPVAAEVYAYKVAQMVNEDNAPIKMVVPADLCEGEIPPLGISSHAPHPYAALLWMQYLMSPEGQEIFSRSGPIPIHPDVKPVFPELQQFLDNVDRLVVIGAGDEEHFAESGKLIKQYIQPRIRSN